MKRISFLIGEEISDYKLIEIKSKKKLDTSRKPPFGSPILKPCLHLSVAHVKFRSK